MSERVIAPPPAFASPFPAPVVPVVPVVGPQRPQNPALPALSSVDLAADVNGASQRPILVVEDEPGLAEVRRAQADGRWDAAYESQKKATVPPDVLAALEQDEAAEKFFRSLDRTTRYRLCLPVL